MKRTGLMLAVFGLFVFAQVAPADWAPTKRLTWNSGDSFFPGIAVDSSGNPHVVWVDSTPGKYEIYYKNSTDAGVTWLTSQRLTWNPGNSDNPDIVIDTSGNVHMVWSYDFGGFIVYKKSMDGGATWTSAQRLTWVPGLPSLPVIAADSSENLHLVFYSFIEGGENAEVFYRKYMK